MIPQTEQEILNQRTVGLHIHQNIKTMEAWAAIVALAFASLVRFPFINMGANMTVLFEASVIVLLSILTWNINKYFSMFLIACVFSVFMSGYDKWGYLALQSVVYGVIWYCVAINIPQRYLLNTICVICLANIALMIMQWFGIYPFFTPLYENAFTGFMCNINHASCLIALSFPAFMRDKWKWFIPVLLIGFLIARSTGGVLAVSIGLVFYAVIHRCKWIIVLIMAGGIGWYFYDLPSLDRFNIWIWGINHTSILGNSLGSWKLANLIVENEHWSCAHNEIVQLTYELGIIFPIILFGYIISIIKKSISIAKEDKDELNRIIGNSPIIIIGIVIVFITAMVNFTFHIAPLAMISLVWLSILESEYAHSNKRNI